MTLSMKFTPKALISAPRRSAVQPNADGILGLYSTQSWSFETHTKSAHIGVRDFQSGQSKVLFDDKNCTDATWLGEGNLVLCLKQGKEKGTTDLVLADAGNVEHEPETLANFDGGFENLKVTALDSDTFALVVTGLATPTGEAYNPEKQKKPVSTGKVYTSLFVRHWDSYVGVNKSAIWYTTLKRRSGSGHQGFVVRPLTNALAGHSFALESPLPPFGGKGDFDISKNGIVFVARDPKLIPAAYTKSNLYYIPLRTFEETQVPPPQLVKTGNLKGYSGSPVFSPDAKSVAFTRMQNMQYESDKPRLLLWPDVTDLNNVQEFFETTEGEGQWDRRPEGITWSKDGKELYVTAEEHGRTKLFKIPASPRHAKDLPTAIVSEGSVTAVSVLSNNKLLISSNSLVDSSVWSIVDPAEPDSKSIISSSLKGGKSFGISQSQVNEIWYEGSDKQKIHAWVIKPSNFDPKKKYPLAYLIHGGPQGAWNDSWSVRWNPLVFAEQGYVVVTPNPTGSTGYGMSLQNNIKENWGGRPYIDLVKGFEYIESNLSYIDTSRAVALGASYGGFMINWIQGHPLGRKFKALVTHDGVFCTLNQYASEELFFPLHDFGGTLWENRAGYEKWDPSAHTGNWETPHLIIHNELDYRLPIGEGLGPFNVLQTRGVESRFLTFPDENHWVLKPENSLVWHTEVISWINKYSGITAEREAEGIGAVDDESASSRMIPLVK
ncbi:related to secreted dipeptidyl-peptidase V precursor [Rhynchosporium graminicola]|uniref:Dipeptidyl-peptidase V n=1 Tax=Rhynchosporium graminicola TaxID=2792576 RepID=A0A1E1LH00_9HELO|nr:related to secreted dipeptidyl-peptidase V precursor [Rhynchosporium commune]